MLFAVHLSDGVLQTAWWVTGWLLAVLLLIWVSRKIDDTEIPVLGVLSAAFFVASQVHLPLGGVSVHLLLNGLVGLILGRKAPLAISVGLLLQLALFGHGGWSTLGLNICIYSFPALIGGIGFRILAKSQLLNVKLFRRVMVWLLLLTVWLGLGLFTLQWTLWKIWPTSVNWSPEWQNWWMFNPLLACGVVLGSTVIAWFEPRLEPSPLFPLGSALGAFTGFATVGLNALTLMFGCRPEFTALPGVVLLAHLPIIVIESLVLGFVVVYLNRAKPEWIK
jgi:ABC-type Co2+ transport system permease subunit